jgi:fido (protein-threonine AMPylation protein)
MCVKSWFSHLAKFGARRLQACTRREVRAEWTEILNKFDDGHLIEVLVLHNSLLSDIGRPAGKFRKYEIVASVGKLLLNKA